MSFDDASSPEDLFNQPTSSYPVHPARLSSPPDDQPTPRFMVTPAKPPATWAPGAVVPGTIYRVIRPLGVGGMGEVYEAEHELLGIRRALKVLGRKLTDREDLAERLRIEARALARLRHPNLVEVHDLGVSTDGRVFFAMELLVGATLRDLLRRTGPLKPDQAVSICIQVLDALGAAHEQGMVHRDVKPENIFVQRSGVVKLLDFGVAKALQGNTPALPVTAVGVAIGTPRYMSPEQAEGRTIDARSDIYSVGVVLWEMLVGRPPYHQLDAIAAAVAAITRGLPGLEESGAPSIPDAIRAALARATSKSPADRYATASAFAADLRLAKARGSSIPPAADKITARYEDAITSLMPVLGELTDPDATATTQLGADATSLDFQPPHATETSSTRYPTPLPIPTSPDHPVLFPRASQPPPAADKTDEIRLLRDSLPFDPRDAPTPTSIPPIAPSPPAAPAAPVAQAAPGRLFWAALPASILLSVFVTWWLVRPAPAPPAPVASAPTASTAAEVARVSITPSAPPPASVTPPPASASAAEPVASAGPAKRLAKDATKPAPRPQGRPGTLGSLPGSGL